MPPPPDPAATRTSPPGEGGAAASAPLGEGGVASTPLGAGDGGVAASAPLGAGAPDPEAHLRAAVDLAFRFIARRDRTVAEVRRNLEKKAVREEAIDHAVAELAELGYLDDARYATRFAEDRVTLDGWGSDRIERRLRDLGVDREHIAAALRGRDFGSELDTAVALLRRRWREPPATPRERDRALGFLVRKGYDLELAYDAIREHTRL